jgi:hypothetical protein
MLEGIVVGLVGAAAIVGTGVAGVFNGSPALRAGTVGVIVALGLTLYLLVTRAGTAMVGAVTVIGALLALQAPKAAAEAVLAGCGEVRAVVVTTVTAPQARDTHDAKYFCSVEHPDGTPVAARIWRGCGQQTQPGDVLGVVYDPKGQVAPRGVSLSSPTLRPMAETAALAVVLMVLCFVAVVRSYRLMPR